MPSARLVVIEGPDVGCEFTIPPHGGGVGRGEDNAVQLSDLAVSRAHFSIERRGERLVLVDAGSRNRTLVNGHPVSAHVLEDGDEIAVGKTRLAFLPAEGGVAVVRRALPSRVTMEIGSGELLRGAELGARAGGGERAHRYLACLADIGDSLGRAADRAALGRTACEVALAALSAERAFLAGRGAGGRITPEAAALRRGDATSGQLALPRDVADAVLGDGKAIAVELPGPKNEPRQAVMAPVGAAGTTTGLLYIDRPGGPPWDRVDVMAAGCLAHLAGGALAALAARDALARENRELEERLGDRHFIGSSPAARALLDFVAKVAPTDATVLLTGESGSGKEMVARAIHRAGRRAGQRLVAVNCAALTETLLESELFGHEQGAFTGATERKIGRFEAADKGVLFLDEIGELPLSCQTKFLRVLEEQCFERVGGTRSIAVDVRVIAATNRDLAEEVRRGRFREDLYYRISVIHTEVPPLRARREDIPELAEHFLAVLRAQVPRRISGFAPEAMQALCDHPWPGNVRELKNAVERAIVLGEGELIRLGDLPPHLAAAAGAAPQPIVWAATPRPTPPAGPGPALAAPPVGAQPAGSARAVTPAPGAAAPGDIGAAQLPPAARGARSLKALEREGIIAALRETGGNKVQAAAILEIDRSTLYKKIKDYGIDA